MKRLRRNALRMLRKRSRTLDKRLHRFARSLPKRRKQARRAVYGQYNKRYRSTYRTRLDRVPARDELPALLNVRGLTGDGAEIGVKLGKYSEYLLDRWKGRRLISIDPWLEDEPDAYVDRANVEQSQHERFYSDTRKRLERFGSRSDIWRMTSVEAAERIGRHSLDFVYIDARHDYDSVKEDLEAWFEKVRPGGILAGHDYADGDFKQGVFGVKRAVDEFFGRRGIPVHSTDGRPPAEMFASWLVQIPAAGREAPALGSEPVSTS
jgi:hypothetical protein